MFFLFFESSIITFEKNVILDERVKSSFQKRCDIRERWKAFEWLCHIFSIEVFHCLFDVGNWQKTKFTLPKGKCILFVPLVRSLLDEGKTWTNSESGHKGTVKLIVRLTFYWKNQLSYVSLCEVWVSIFLFYRKQKKTARNRPVIEKKIFFISVSKLSFVKVDSCLNFEILNMTFDCPWKVPIFPDLSKKKIVSQNKNHCKIGKKSKKIVI